MTAAGVLAKRLRVPAGEVAALCAGLGLLLPPGLDAAQVPVRTEALLVDGAVHPSVAAGLAATCSPRIAVHVSSPVGDVRAVFGVRGELGGSMLRADGSDIELSVWPATRLGRELARAVPVLGTSPIAPLHLPLDELPDRPELQGAVGALRATVVAPPHVIGQVVWLATREGWLSLAPAEARDGRRWASVQPVDPTDLGAAVAPLVAVGLA